MIQEYADKWREIVLRNNKSGSINFQTCADEFGKFCYLHGYVKGASDVLREDISFVNGMAIIMSKEINCAVPTE